MSTKARDAEIKATNAEIQQRGAQARKRGEALTSNPYRDSGNEVVSQAMREHKAKLWAMGWKRQDAMGRF